MSARSSEFPASIQQRTERWFQRASDALLGQLPCRAGCSHCCIGPFPITLLDVVTLQKGLDGLPSRSRGEIILRASEQTAAMEEAYPMLSLSAFLDRWTDADIDRLVTRFDSMPCPALGTDGQCRLYEYRPLACRSMGIPEEHEATVKGACAVQNFVPIVRLSAAMREEEQRLASLEVVELDRCRQESGAEGEEVLLPYGFLPPSRHSERRSLR